MKLTDKQRIKLFKAAIPILKDSTTGYCWAFQEAAFKVGLYLDAYSVSFRIDNMQDFKPFFKKDIMKLSENGRFLPIGNEYNKHRIAVLKYVINQLEIKVYGEVKTEF